MRKVVLNLAVSLDGYIEGPNGEYDWCFNDDDYGLTNFFDSIDAIFIGRKSYELIVRNGDLAMFATRRMYVFSDTHAPIQHESIEIVPKLDFLQTVKDLKEHSGKNIWLFGGASLVSSFIEQGLIDELMLSVHPIILGCGKALFNNLKKRVPLRLVDSQTYPSGLVQLRYSVPSTSGA